jgi:hypothetical protein
MNEEIQTVIFTEENVRISVDEYNEGVWLSLQGHGASMYTTLTIEEAKQMLAGLQKVLNKEVTA